MSNQHISDTSQSMLIQLEVMPEDEQESDIADVGEVGRSLFEQLTNSGFTVAPTTTGRKGGGPLFDILVQIPQLLYDNKDWLLAMLNALPPVLQTLLIARDMRADKERTKRAPLKITLQVDDKVMTIEASDVKDAEKLLKQLQSIHPEGTKIINAQSQVKIGVSVPKKKRRGSH
jgi:hypothetical protein